MSQQEAMQMPLSVKSGRGFGYFWWKPFIIRKALEATMPDGVVFYSDCGRYDGGFRLGRGVGQLLSAYRKTGFAGVEVPQFGASRMWTRKECFDGLDGVGGDSGEMPQIQATFSLWINNPETLAFVRKWELACRVPSYICDPTGDELLQQHSQFIAHRHDQSILSILVRKYRFPFIQLANRIDLPILRLLRRSHVANVEMKKVEFVARVVAGRPLFLELVLSHFCNKSVRFRKLLGRPT